MLVDIVFFRETKKLSDSASSFGTPTSEAQTLEFLSPGISLAPFISNNPEYSN